MPREQKRSKAQAQAFEDGFAEASHQTDGQVARSVLSLIADGIDSCRARLSRTPAAVSALGETIAILRDAANVCDPNHPQDRRSTTAEDTDGA